MPEETSILLLAGLLAFGITALLVLALQPVALELGLADEPGGRKKHGARVPVIGGVAMAIGVGFGLSLVRLPDSWEAIRLAVVLLVGIGAIDDRFGLSPAVRLFGQALAALAAVVGAGVVVRTLGEPLTFAMPLGFLGPLFTVLLVMTVVNGFNLIDGIDGLAGSVALVSLATLALVGAGTVVFAIAVIVAAAVAAFLLFNFPLHYTRRLRVFMGDAGSTGLGFMIACLAITLSQGEAARIAPVTALWLLAVPLYEVLSAFWRRLKTGRSPWTPDDGHLHHMLLARGISPRRTLAFMVLVAAGFAAGGVLGQWLGVPEGLMLAGWIAGAIAYYRMTWEPKPVALWVRSWKDCELPDATFVELRPVTSRADSGE